MDECECCGMALPPSTVASLALFLGVDENDEPAGPMLCVECVSIVAAIRRDRLLWMFRRSSHRWFISQRRRP